ncbi:hypothetical protein BKA83DRAFT_4130734 [Pisolithus microcarpus]|nr:hypothetical protein BKA83DRAFT_4130734 [Pisolithus microcarpus]
MVPLKCKHSEDIVKVYLQKKITLQAPLGREPSDHQVDQVPLKCKHSMEFLKLHWLNKVAHVAVQGIDMPSPMCSCSNEVSSNDWQNLQGCNPMTHLDNPVMQNQKLLQEVAMPLFFQLVHFEPSQAPTSLHVESDMLGALLVWRHTNAFVMPDSIWFSVTGATTDHHLQALSIFFKSLQSSPIARLTLTNTSLMTVQWTTLLKHLSLQHLLSLAVDSSCPIQSLVGFLAHHNVKDLIFSQGQPTSTHSPHVQARHNYGHIPDSHIALPG